MGAGERLVVVPRVEDLVAVTIKNCLRDGQAEFPLRRIDMPLYYEQTKSLLREFRIGQTSGYPHRKLEHVIACLVMRHPENSSLAMISYELWGPDDRFWDPQGDTHKIIGHTSLFDRLVLYKKENVPRARRNDAMVYNGLYMFGEVKHFDADDYRKNPRKYAWAG